MPPKGKVIPFFYHKNVNNMNSAEVYAANSFSNPFILWAKTVSHRNYTAPNPVGYAVTALILLPVMRKKY